MLRIGGAAVNTTPLDWEGNKDTLINAIEYARMNGVELLCLPELCITGYGCEDLFLTDWVPAKAALKLIELCAYTYDITVALGFPLSYQGTLYNAVALVQNTEIKGVYCKKHLANDGIHYEHRWFQPWPSGKVCTWQIAGHSFPLGDALFELSFAHGSFKIGFEICEDAWRTPTRPAIAYVQQGVDILLNPSASHFSMGKSSLRRELVTQSSSQFSCTYVYANLLGNEAGRVIFDGEILIASGGVLLQANPLCSFQAFNVIYTDVIPKSPGNPTPTLPSLASKEEEFTQACTLGLYDYMRKSKSQGYTLSLSGGADSSACAVLVHQMLIRGSKELGLSYFLRRGGITSIDASSTVEQCMDKLLLCIYQASAQSSDQTWNSARSLAQALGTTCLRWDIDPWVNSYRSVVEHSIQRTLSWDTDDLALQNIQARVRTPALWMMANLRNHLLITTSNRSEGDVGYCTMDGDTAGSIAPIAGVSKHFIKNYLIWAQQTFDLPSLHYVNSMAPSAELRPLDTLQTDEADLMPYSVLEKIEIWAIEQRQSPAQVHALATKTFSHIDPEIIAMYVTKFYKLWTRNQWKRERMAPSFYLDTFNIDPRTWYRFPILSGGFEDDLPKKSQS